MCRYLFHDFVARIMAKEKRFGALALTLQHDGIRLLVMIRLCPLPFTLTNAALSSIPTVHWAQFAAATAAASPKLLLHVWIGAQLALLAEKGDKMDARTKAVSVTGMVVGSVAGLATGAWIYMQTVKRSKELRALEEAEQGMLDPEEFADEDDAELSDGTTEYLREEEDDISLRDDGWDDDYSEPYQDSSGEGSVNESPPRPG
jgi:SNARE associated Golgi protein